LQEGLEVRFGRIVGRDRRGEGDADEEDADKEQSNGKRLPGGGASEEAAEGEPA
jgi:hypothetical protein